METNFFIAALSSLSTSSRWKSTMPTQLTLGKWESINSLTSPSKSLSPLISVNLEDSAFKKLKMSQSTLALVKKSIGGQKELLPA